MIRVTLNRDTPTHFLNLVTNDMLSVTLDRSSRATIKCSDNFVIIRDDFPDALKEQIFHEGWDSYAQEHMAQQKQWLGQIVQVNGQFGMLGIVRSVLLSCDAQGMSHTLLVEWPYPEITDSDVGLGHWTLQSPALTEVQPVDPSIAHIPPEPPFRRFLQIIRMFSDTWRTAWRNS